MCVQYSVCLNIPISMNTGWGMYVDNLPTERADIPLSTTLGRNTRPTIQTPIAHVTYDYKYKTTVDKSGVI